MVTGGALSNRKGVNVPQATLPLAALTDKDRRDLDFALQLGVDWVALSFVQRPDDVAEAKKLVAGRAGVMVKLEKPQAIEHLDELIELADAMMVARGDLASRCRPRMCRAAEAHRPGVPARRQAGGRGDPDARVDDHRADPRRAPRHPTSRPRSMTAPTP